MDSQFSSNPNSEAFSEEQNPLTDQEYTARSAYAVPHPEFHFPKTRWLLAGIISGFIGIGIALVIYMGTRIALFTFLPFDPQSRAGLDFLLVLCAILLSIIIESGVALLIARSKQVFSLLLSWLIFFGFIGTVVYVISLNTRPI